MIAVGYGIVAPALPEYARSFDVGITAATAVVSGFALVRLAFAPVSGRLVDRLGEPFVFTCGLLVVAASSAASAFARNYAELLVFRSLGGAGSTMFTVAAASLLIRRTPSGMRGRAMASWATGWLAGTVAGPLVGGGLIAMISLRAPFLAYAGLLVVVAVLLGARLRGPGTGPAVPQRDAVPSLTFVAALRSPTFRAALTSNFLDGWTVFGIRIALVPLFVVDVVARSGSWSGPALTAFAAGTVATLTLGGHLADRWGRRPTVIVGTLVVAATTLWLGISTSLVELLIVCALSGAGSGLMTPPVEAALADVVGDRNRGGPAVAGFQMVGDVGAILGPVLGGWAVELGGYPAAFALTALIAVGSMFCWFVVSDRDGGHPTHRA